MNWWTSSSLDYNWYWSGILFLFDPSRSFSLPNTISLSLFSVCLFLSVFLSLNLALSPAMSLTPFKAFLKRFYFDVSENRFKSLQIGSGFKMKLPSSQTKLINHPRLLKFSSIRVDTFTFTFTLATPRICRPLLFRLLHSIEPHF